MLKFRKVYKTKIVIILAVIVLVVFTKTLYAFIMSEGALRVSFDKEYSRIQESLGRLTEIQKAVKIEAREKAYADWRSRSRTIEMFSEAALAEKQAFLRYGRGSESKLPSGKGYYGESAVMYLRPSSSLRNNISIVYDAFRKTQAYRNRKLRLFDYKTLHHTFKIYVNFEDRAIPKSLHAQHKRDLQRVLVATAGFGVYLEGVNWDGNGYKFVLQAYPTQQFLDVEEKLRGRHYDRIDFNFCIIVDELNQEELDELLSLVEIYAKIPIGFQEVKAISLVQHKDEMLAEPISVEDIKFFLLEEPNFKDIEKINRVIREQL